jgi:hypothetical protein
LDILRGLAMNIIKFLEEYDYEGKIKPRRDFYFTTVQIPTSISGIKEEVADWIWGNDAQWSEQRNKLIDYFKSRDFIEIYICISKEDTDYRVTYAGFNNLPDDYYKNEYESIEITEEISAELEHRIVKNIN